MDTSQFDWNQARAFLATAETGSFSAAAQALRVAQLTIGRQIAALEARLGLALFERVPGGVSLTPVGAELVKQVHSMRDAADAVNRIAAGHNEEIEGIVSISATEFSAAVYLPPIVAKLRDEEPGIRINIIAENRISDLLRREADIAIRNLRPTEPDVFARKIGEFNAGLYATQAYIDRKGRPETLADLSDAEFIDSGTDGYWRNLLAGLGLNMSDRNFPVLTENQLAFFELARLGLGITALEQRIAKAYPIFHRILTDFPPITFPVWLVAHRDLKSNRRIRRVFDFLATALA